MLIRPPAPQSSSQPSLSNTTLHFKQVNWPLSAFDVRPTVSAGLFISLCTDSRRESMSSHHCESLFLSITYTTVYGSKSFTWNRRYSKTLAPHITSPRPRWTIWAPELSFLFAYLVSRATQINVRGADEWAKWAMIARRRHIANGATEINWGLRALLVARGRKNVFLGEVYFGVPLQIQHEVFKTRPLKVNGIKV